MIYYENNLELCFVLEFRKIVLFMKIILKILDTTLHNLLLKNFLKDLYLYLLGYIFL